MTRTGVEAQIRAVAGLSTYGPPRVTVLPPPRQRRRGRVGAVALIGGLTALVLLGGVGVAWALVNDQTKGANSLAEPPPTSAPAFAGGTGQVGNAPTPVTTLNAEPLAHRVVSVAKPTVLGTVKVGNEPEGMAVSPDSRTLYVADQSAHVLSVVDAGTRQVSSVTLRNTPRFVAVSRDGRQVFVSMYENDKSGSGVAVLDAAGRDVDHYLTTGKQPYALSVYAFDAGSRYSYLLLPKPWISTTSGRCALAADGSVTVVSSGTPSQVVASPEHCHTPCAGPQLASPSGAAARAGAAAHAASASMAPSDAAHERLPCPCNSRIRGSWSIHRARASASLPALLHSGDARPDGRRDVLGRHGAARARADRQRPRSSAGPIRKRPSTWRRRSGWQPWR